MVRPFLLGLALVLAGCGGESKAPHAPNPSAAASKRSAAPSPEPLADPLTVGSQEARDAYYCAGLLFAAYPQPQQALTPDDMAAIFRGRDEATALSMEGFGRLMDEKAAQATQAGQVADAWADVAAKDLAAGKPRIPLKTCEAQGAKLAAQ